MKTLYVLLSIKIIIVLVLCVGWVKCLIRFTDCDFNYKTTYKAEILYGIGTFTVIGGGILGYCDFGK